MTTRKVINIDIRFDELCHEHDHCEGSECDFQVPCRQEPHMHSPNAFEQSGLHQVVREIRGNNALPAVEENEHETVSKLGLGQKS